MGRKSPEVPALAFLPSPRLRLLQRSEVGLNFDGAHLPLCGSAVGFRHLRAEAFAFRFGRLKLSLHPGQAGFVGRRFSLNGLCN